MMMIFLLYSYICYDNSNDQMQYKQSEAEFMGHDNLRIKTYK